MTQNKVRVDLADRGYDIIVDDALLPEAGKYIKEVTPTSRVFIITDENIASLHLKTLQESLDREDIKNDTIIVPAGEGTKSFPELEKVLDQLLDSNPERKDTLVALGGGVIGDLTGFAASILLRGVNFVQIPTTLLAMVDSSVGGKTGINTKYGKNLVGSFYQPKLVLADIALLSSLPEREFLAGYAEIVKYGLIGDVDFFNDLENNPPAIGDHERLREIIIHSCKMKADIVARDEREGGVRALLNLGHTFAHALEAEAKYDGTLLHGEAVAIGMVMAFKFSVKLGLCLEEHMDRAREHLFAVGLPVSPLDVKNVDFKAVKLLEHMYQDKKVKDNKLVFILAMAIGEAFIKEDVDAKEMLGFLEQELS